MANRRMLTKSISISDQVAQLDDFAALLFTWMIAHADDWGVLPGSPTKLRALVIPQREASIEKMTTALDAMERAQLIWRYTWTDGTAYVQLRKWDEHQDLHKRTAPRQPRYQDIPGNNGYEAVSLPVVPEVPGSSRKFPPNRTELNGNRSELNTHSQPSPLAHESRARVREATPTTPAQRPQPTPRPQAAQRPQRPPLAADVAELIEPCPRLASAAVEWEHRVCELSEAGYSRADLERGVLAYKRAMSEKIPLTLRAFCAHAQRLIGDGNGESITGPTILEIERRRGEARRAEFAKQAEEHQRAARELAAQPARRAIPGGSG